MTLGSFSLDEPTTFADRIHRMIKLGLSGLGVDMSDDTPAADLDDDMPELEDGGLEAESKMEEVWLLCDWVMRITDPICCDWANWEQRLVGPAFGCSPGSAVFGVACADMS
jgi:hypothetical protein